MVQQEELLNAARVTMGMLTSYYVLGLLAILMMAAALVLEPKTIGAGAFIRPLTWIAYPVMALISVGLAFSLFAMVFSDQVSLLVAQFAAWLITLSVGDGK